MDWTGAACDGMDTEAFFAPDDFTHPELTQPERYRAALDVQLQTQLICAGCPVRAQCLKYAVDNAIDDGVWGGWTETQRMMFRVRSHRGAVRVNRFAFRGPLSPHEERVIGAVRAGVSLDQVADRFDLTTDQVRGLARKALAALAA